MDTRRIQNAAVTGTGEGQHTSFRQDAQTAAIRELGLVVAYHRCKAALPEIQEVLELGEQAVKEAEVDLKGKRAALPKLEKALAAAQKEMAQVEKRRQEDRALSAIPMLQGSPYPDDPPVHGPRVSPTLIAERLARSEVRVTEGRTWRAVEMGLEGATRDLRKAKDTAESAERRLAQVRKWTGQIRRRLVHHQEIERPETPTWTLFLEA